MEMPTWKSWKAVSQPGFMANKNNSKEWQGAGALLPCAQLRTKLSQAAVDVVADLYAMTKVKSSSSPSTAQPSLPRTTIGTMAHPSNS